MKNNLLFIFFLFILVIGVIGIVFWAYYLAEKRKKEKIRDSFKSFSEKKKIKQEDLRSVPRTILPELLNIVLTLTDESYFGLKSLAIDISETGFSVKPDFPLRKLPVNAVLNNVLVRTPINEFVIDKIKTIRYEHEIKKRLLAFEIIAIDENQKNKMLIFMNYLDNYMKNGS